MLPSFTVSAIILNNTSTDLFCKNFSNWNLFYKFKWYKTFLYQVTLIHFNPFYMTATVKPGKNPRFYENERV